MKIAIAIILAKTLLLSFEYRETNPASLFPYYNAAQEYSEFGHLSNPAFLPLWNVTYFNTSYEKPYSIDEINSGNIRIGAGYSDYGIQLAWSRFGIKEYREDVIEGNAGYRLCKYLSSGFGVSYYNIYINTGEIKYREGLFDYRISLLFIPFSWINMSLQQENINSIFNRGKEDMLHPDRCFGISVRPARGISFSWNVNRIYYGYINTFSLSTNLLSCLSLKAGYSRETSSFAGSIIFLYKFIRVSYGLRHHPYLDLSHAVGVTITSSALEFEQVNYNKMLYRQSLPAIKKKININKCAEDELKDIPVLSKEIAERIIKYRSIIGPVNKKALIQIGMQTKEVEDLKKYITGLVPEPTAPEKENAGKASRTIKYKKYSRRSRGMSLRKNLFKKLLESGISASTALRIAELSREKGKKNLIVDIKGLSGLTSKQKTLVIKICDGILD